MADPACTYYGTCGGCSSQHVDYSAQLESKVGLLRAQSGVTDIKVFSGKQYGYRNRVDMVFTSQGIGFRKKEQWFRTVDIERCAIANDPINGLIREVRECFTQPDYFDVKKKTGTFKYAVIRASRLDTSITFIVNPETSRLTEATEAIESFAKITSATNVLIGYVGPESSNSITDDFLVIKGQATLRESFLGKTFLYHSQGFFQNNSEMAEEMQRYVHQLVKTYPTHEQHLLDLYGGVGTFGIVNAELFKSVLVIESIEQAITLAQQNAAQNGATNVTAQVLDAKYLKRLSLPQPLMVITDPPRTGMDPHTIEALMKAAPATIIYISCNIKQLGADLPKLKGYSVRSAALFDLFPQTPHAEAILELCR